jgi:hypothetical protein
VASLRGDFFFVCVRELNVKRTSVFFVSVFCCGKELIFEAKP